MSTTTRDFDEGKPALLRAGSGGIGASVLHVSISSMTNSPAGRANFRTARPRL